MKLVTPDLEQRDFEFSELMQNPEISKEVLQALVYLIGYDITNKTFRFANIDSDGRLYVSSGAVKTSDAALSQATADTTAVELIASTSTRKAIEIYNNGTETVYIGFDSGVTIVTGFPIPSGASWYNENYIGAIFGITQTVTCDMRIMEFY